MNKTIKIVKKIKNTSTQYNKIKIIKDLNNNGMPGKLGNGHDFNNNSSNNSNNNNNITILPS